MGIKTFNPYTPSRRQMTALDKKDITKKTPEKSLLAVSKKNSGRNNQGKITVRHRGGGTRKQYRIIDFKRNKDGIFCFAEIQQAAAEARCKAFEPQCSERKETEKP